MDTTQPWIMEYLVHDFPETFLEEVPNSPLLSTVTTPQLDLYITEELLRHYCLVLASSIEVNQLVFVSVAPVSMLTLAVE